MSGALYLGGVMTGYSKTPRDANISPSGRTGKSIKARVNVKAALTSLNMTFLPISRSHFKRR